MRAAAVRQLLGNLALLYYVISTDPGSLLWCAALIGLGGVLYVVEQIFGSKGTGRRTPTTTEGA